jgi:phage baseplate assembly protein W
MDAEHPGGTFPVEVAFPFHLDGYGRTALAAPDRHLRDLVEQLLFTSPGERVMRPDFGCGLLDAVFAPNSPELVATLELSVHAALHRWLGDLLDVESLDVVSEGATVRVDLRYAVRRTGERHAQTFVGPQEGNGTP